jgi:TonB family protein
MPPGTQRHWRTKMVLPLRIWLDEQNADGAAPQLAHTVDISPGGGRLGGLRILVQPGETILIQRGQQKAQFRVVWSKQMGPGEIQAGVESLDSDKRVWGIELPDQPSASGNLGAPSGKTRLPSKTAVTSQSLLTRVRSAASLDTQIRWSAVVGTFLIALASVVYIQRRSAQDSEVPPLIIGVSPSAPVETPESTSPVRPHGDERVFTFLRDEPGSPPVSRLRVAEAPLGHPFSPVSPDSDVSGRVDLKIVIATDGRVKQVEVLSGKQILAEASVRAVRFWRYAPPKSNGRPAEAETSAVIQFRAGDAVSIHFPSESANKADQSRPAAVPAQYTSQ